MIANYGYKDGSGEYFIAIDTDKCTGCGDCVSACPAGVLVVVDEDPNDPLREEPVALINDENKKNKLKYLCGPCKAEGGKNPEPCIAQCIPSAISHSW
jgi:ferredoxin